jgi:hypothetical protein
MTWTCALLLVAVAALCNATNEDDTNLKVLSPQCEILTTSIFFFFLLTLYFYQKAFDLPRKGAVDPHNDMKTEMFRVGPFDVAGNSRKKAKKDDLFFFFFFN